jgi:peptide/nickel transport system permease protein
VSAGVIAPAAARTRTFRRQPEAFAGAILLGSVVLACILVPIIWPQAPDAIGTVPLQAPSLSHPFGTDQLGRDVFVRTFAGGRIDLFVACTTVVVSCLIGSLVGVVAGLSGGWVDSVLMRLVDAIIAFPFMVLVLVIVLLFGATTSLGPFPAGMPSLLFAIIVTDWAVYARLGRAQTLSLRSREFVIAGRLLGYSHARLVIRHLFPNVAGAVAAYMVSDAVLQVMVCASLPFLGAGIQPPTPEWGAIMLGGSNVLESAWWITLFPAAILALTGVGLSLVSDSVVARSGGASP